ncbi:MAG: hypothetical protein LBK99_10220 [Opitutaceae bacterium]|jgi:hypothetical protein|nr:hypothetical protein [Opitutaceae bacterium]
MKTTKQKSILFAGLVGLAPMIQVHAAPATEETVVIYTDNFNRAGTFNGSSPVVGEGAPSWATGATWNASSNITTDGSKLNIYSESGANYANAFLPVTLSADSGIYTLTVTVAFTGGSNWLLAGFSNGTTNISGTTYSGALGWASYNNAGNVSGYTSGASSFGSIAKANSSGSTPLTLSISLNTDTSVTTNNVTITLLSGDKINDSIITTLTASQISSIKGIELGSYQGAVGTFEDLSFTVTNTVPIPEAATTGLLIAPLALFTACLSVHRRRK